MVTAKTVKGLADRLVKAEALVAEGAVFPVAGLTGYAVVRNGDGTQMYLVRHEEGFEHCTCADFRERQSKAGLPCKHIIAAQLAGGSDPAADALAAELWESVSTTPDVDPAKVAAARACGFMAPAAA